jgi:serine/threonine protein phosphatase PrpC
MRIFFPFTVNFLVGCSVILWATTTANETETVLDHKKNAIDNEKHQQSPPNIQYSTSRDIIYDSHLRVAIQSLKEHGSVEHSDAISSIGSKGAFAMKLVGSKGGPLEIQVNQDRAFVVQEDRMVAVGVLDGHGNEGHHVAELGKQELLRHLQRMLNETSEPENNSNDNKNHNNMTEFWTKALDAIDASVPHAVGGQHKGGATVSVGFVLDQHTFVAINAGDSQTMVGAVYQSLYKNASKPIFLIFETRLDKPTDPDEQIRIQRDHPTARVELDSDHDVARVWFPEGFGLAMTRAIGDLDAPAIIATPTVTILKVEDMLEEVSETLQQAHTQDCQVTDDGEVDCHVSLFEFDPEKVDWFMFSVTDGLLDVMTAFELTERVGNGLFVGTDHPYVTASEVLLECRDRWKLESPRYRDDMALAVAQVHMRQ